MLHFFFIFFELHDLKLIDVPIVFRPLAWYVKFALLLPAYGSRPSCGAATANSKFRTKCKDKLYQPNGQSLNGSVSDLKN